MFVLRNLRKILDTILYIVNVNIIFGELYNVLVS